MRIKRMLTTQPPELIELQLLLLDLRSLQSLRCVCKSLDGAVSDERLWRRKIRRDFEGAEVDQGDASTYKLLLDRDLHTAIKLDRVDLLIYLTERRPDPELTEVAAIHNARSTLTWLLGRPNPYREILFGTAARLSTPETLRLFMNSGSRVTGYPISMAALTGRIDNLELLTTSYKEPVNVFTWIGPFSFLDSDPEQIRAFREGVRWLDDRWMIDNEGEAAIALDDVQRLRRAEGPIDREMITFGTMYGSEPVAAHCRQLLIERV